MVCNFFTIKVKPLVYETVSHDIFGVQNIVEIKIGNM